MVHVIKSKDPKVPPRIQLDPSWQCARDPETGALLAQGRLWDFTEKIASSRREGKNRRDGATVSSRVLRLTDELGAKLFLEAEAGSAKVPSRLSKEEKETLKRSAQEAKRKGRKERRSRL
jgi:hypothetical protein